LRTTSLRKSKPKDDDELEGVVEGEPVNGIDSTFKDSEECEDNPVCKPLGIVALPDAEERLEGVVARNHKSSKVGQ